MKLLVVNCNTSRSTTAAIGRTARAAARPGTHIQATQPSWGVESAEGYFDSFVSAAAVLDTLITEADGYDAVVMAGYGEHGREGARQALTIPVVDITEASAQLACLVGHRFGVVTSLATTVPGIIDNLQAIGLYGRCVGVRASDIPVLELNDDLDRTATAVADRATELMTLGAESIVLGCAGMAGLTEAVESKLAVPVIDSVGAGVVVAEALVGLGLQTSKVGAYAPLDPRKVRPGWPINRRS